MKNKKETIKKIVSFINNEEENGGLWLPNIQRKFVWKKVQMEKLFDSIMRQYPISTMLVWKTKDNIKSREFIRNYKNDVSLQDYFNNEKRKLIVLDGQQRLQSLFIGLKGNYNGSKLYFNVFSGFEEGEELKYNFKFLNDDKASFENGWVKLEELIYNTKDYYEISDEVISKFPDGTLTDGQKSQIRKNIAVLVKVFVSEEVIAYQELDSVDNPELYSIDDVVEIFIRANSGGTPLSKSDLMFSLLTANWDEVEDELAELTTKINESGYKFSRDFVLKTSLVLIEAGAKYDVTKFRKPETFDNIKNNWKKIQDSVKDVRDFIYSQTLLRTDKALTSYIPIIPLIYYKYKYPEKWQKKNGEDIGNWLLKVLATGAFSGSSDSILDAVVNDIKRKQDFDINSINAVIRNKGRNINLTEEALLNTYYGDGRVYLLFSIWYRKFDFQPSFKGNLPNIDHMFPQSKLKDIKIENPKTNREIMKYDKKTRDQIGNLMLLSQGENCDLKRAKTLEEWLEGKDDDYLDLHLIPKNKELWRMDNYEEFIQARNKKIIEKFSQLNLLEN